MISYFSDYSFFILSSNSCFLFYPKFSSAFLLISINFFKYYADKNYILNLILQIILKLFIMLTSDQQQKIMTALLKKQENSLCPDCNGKSPCWASIDFGVFVCLNCSGAHRALGPSITRVRSTKLDTWNKQWLQNMQIGNSIVNKYWESALSSNFGGNPKPNTNSSLTDIKKFVYDKYVKKKYVNPNDKYDPLTKLKMGIPLYEQQKKIELPKQQPKKIINNVKSQQIPKKQIKKPIQSLIQFDHPPKNFNKKSAFQFDFDFNAPINSNNLKVHNQKSQKPKFDKLQFNTVSGNSMSNDQHSNFQNFLGNVSNKTNSFSSHSKTNEGYIHQNYLMNHQNLVTSGQFHTTHGQSMPNIGFHTPGNVTMNINMNMYPNIMNINMSGYNTTIPQQVPYHPQMQTHSVNHGNINQVNPNFNQFMGFENKKNDQIPTNQKSNNINMEVTIKTEPQTVKKQKTSWVDDWM